MIDLTEIRAREPHRIAEAWAARKRRPLLGDDGQMMIVAADHPARGALSVRGDGNAMSNRRDLLERLATSLERPGVDGVLGTADILDDLLLMGALEGKLVFGSMNRGGLMGAGFEFDDRMTGHTVSEIVQRGFDGGKMLNRICYEDAGTVAMLERSAVAIDELAAAGKMAMLEPFISTRDAETGKVKNLLDPDNVIKSIAIAEGLGATSAYTWLKLPVVDEIERVMESTTMPSLLLGGEPKGDPEEAYASWQKALEIDTVRGLIIGRTLLYPPDGDVAGAVDIAAKMVHG
ncbi:Cgl0159 family (beta/alpha)8-fold protein [Nocardioides bruguierae]|uniref:Deoxyribose-phosphate aldolase n=1 Tax=Nocardioides bruguierae TaxID=2945102 RepID=A0A9X2DA81_9ACTN|nr:deoxyribose-phosphate aldolase [Nocardioides bruguierae]MCL8024534.1 deoxyribose-phosphate aldolase [Nocardioides bruguierae]MCM0620849.1 deoxyribose-phosphate aldolase [Nocardioides bruguierae]